MYTTPNKHVWKLPASTQLRATWHWLARHGSPTIYRWFALPQLLCRWRHQSGIFCIPLSSMTQDRTHWQTYCDGVGPLFLCVLKCAFLDTCIRYKYILMGLAVRAWRDGSVLNWEAVRIVARRSRIVECWSSQRCWRYSSSGLRRHVSTISRS
jgi:hypothetical protein